MDIVSDIMARLPPGSRVRLVDVCVAIDRNREVVEGWIESGEVDALDLGGKSYRSWEISKASLEAFLRRRGEGVRMKHDARQLNLFSEAPSTKHQAPSTKHEAPGTRHQAQ